MRLDLAALTLTWGLVCSVIADGRLSSLQLYKPPTDVTSCAMGASKQERHGEYYFNEIETHVNSDIARCC